jgi:hypothetical protein
MSNSKQKTVKKNKSDDEARKNVAIQRGREEQCCIGLMRYFEETLTVAETALLMKDVYNVEVKSLMSLSSKGVELWDDRWRVNMWTKTKSEGSFMFSYGIKFSAFVVWDKEFGVTRCDPDVKKAIRSNFKTSSKDIFK